MLFPFRCNVLYYLWFKTKNQRQIWIIQIILLHPRFTISLFPKSILKRKKSKKISFFSDTEILDWTFFRNKKTRFFCLPSGESTKWKNKMKHISVLTDPYPHPHPPPPEMKHFFWLDPHHPPFLLSIKKCIFLGRAQMKQISFKFKKKLFCTFP